MSVKAFMCFHLRNLRSNPSPCVVNSNVHIDTVERVTGSQRSFLCSFQGNELSVKFVHPIISCWAVYG